MLDGFDSEKMKETVTLDDMICRICENKIPPNIMTQHTDLCTEKVNLKNDYHTLNLKIIELSENIYVHQQNY